MAAVRQIAIAVQEASQVADARRQAALLATGLGLDAAASGRLALCVTEAATNLVKHAGGGQLFLRALEGEGAGIEVLSVDKGPGIPNLAECMQDGYSTAGSPGTGLGALSRLGTHLEVYTGTGKGTALRFEIHGRGTSAPDGEFGAITVPKRGESECGDACAFLVRAGHSTLIVADGLGHGPQAALASRAAVDVVSAHPEDDPAHLISTAHAALASTRGAAVAVAAVDHAAGKGSYCGVGNISGLVHAGPRAKHLISHNGTVGHAARKIQQFDFEFPPGALLIMYSDGLQSHWTLADYPGLEAKHPSLIAAVLGRDHDRGRDDLTVAVLRAPAR